MATVLVRSDPPQLSLSHPSRKSSYVLPSRSRRVRTEITINSCSFQDACAMGPGSVNPRRITTQTLLGHQSLT
jgi:hypothetical protein